MYSFLSRTCLLSDILAYLRTQERERKRTDMGKARNGDATPNRQIHGTVKNRGGIATLPIVCTPRAYKRTTQRPRPETGRGPPRFFSQSRFLATLPSLGNAPCCVKDSARNVKRWGVVVAVVAAVKEEVGKIEDGEIATEGGANVITREKGSGGERRIDGGQVAGSDEITPDRLLCPSMPMTAQQQRLDYFFAHCKLFPTDLCG